MKKFKSLFPLIIFYLIIAILFTWPLVLNLNSHGFGTDEDSPYHIWHNWWLKFALFDLRQNPLWTNFIFYPQRIPLIYDANSFVFAALTLPLQFILSVLTASNIVFLFAFVISGLSMFALVSYILRTQLPIPPQRDPALAVATNYKLLSFLAGLIFAFSPYTLSQAMDGHTNLTTTWIIPLYTLFLLKSIEVPNIKSALMTGIFAALQFYSDFTYTTFLIIETGLIIFYYTIFAFLRNPATEVITTLKHIIVTAFIILITTAFISTPLILEVVKVTKTGFKVGSPLWVQNEWGADLKAFFRPSDRSTFLKPLAYTPPRGTVEGTVFPGYTLIFLFLVGLLAKTVSLRIKSRPLRESGGNRESEKLNLWIFLSLSFFVLSLGPTLHYNGQFQFNIFNLKGLIFPLPWFILHKIPLLGEVQETARINPFLMLSLAIVVSLLFSSLLKKIKAAKTSTIIVISVTLLIIVEYLPIPFPLTDLRPPEIYKTIGNDNGHFSVLVLPLGFNSGNVALGKSPIGSLQYFQVIHKHPSFRGTVARLPAWTFDYYRKLPLVKYLIDPSSSPDKDDLDSAKAYATIKNQLNVGYIVIHKNKYEGETYKRVQEVLSKTLPLEFISEDEKTTSYKLK